MILISTVSGDWLAKGLTTVENRAIDSGGAAKMLDLVKPWLLVEASPFAT